MIKYLLLTDYVDKKEKSNYRGVFRAGLMHRSPIGDEGILYELWFEAVYKVDDDGFFDNLEDAIDICNKFAKYGLTFNITACIDVTTGDVDTVLPQFDNFLGYDVCDRRLHSLIYFYGYGKENDNLKIDTNYILRTLSLKFYYDKINRYNLFHFYQDACTFIQSEKDIIKVYPELDNLHLLDTLSNCFKIYKLYEM